MAKGASVLKLMAVGASLGPAKVARRVISRRTVTPWSLRLPMAVTLALRSPFSSFIALSSLGLTFSPCSVKTAYS